MFELICFLMYQDEGTDGSWFSADLLLLCLVLLFKLQLILCH